MLECKENILLLNSKVVMIVDATLQLGIGYIQKN